MPQKDEWWGSGVLLVGKMILPEAFKMDTAYKLHVGKGRETEMGEGRTSDGWKCDSLPQKKKKSGILLSWFLFF